MSAQDTSRPELPFAATELEEVYEKPTNEATRAQAVIPFVIGILSVGALFVRPFGLYLALLLSIVGVALGTRGARRGSTMAGVGRALSVAALCVSSIVLIVAVVTGSEAVTAVLTSAFGLNRV